MHKHVSVTQKPSDQSIEFGMICLEMANDAIFQVSSA